MVKISNDPYENEIHRVDSPFKRGFEKYNFFGPNLGGGTAGKFRENNQKQGNPIVMDIREWSVLIGNTASAPWYHSLCITLVSLHVRSNYLLKTEEVSFQAKFCPNFTALPSLKLGTFFKF